MITDHDLNQLQQEFTANTQPGWLQNLREKALARWLEKGLPTLRDERWKYTELAALKQNIFSNRINHTDNYQALLPITPPASLQLLLVDGKLITSNLPKDFYCSSLSDTLKNAPEKIQKYLTQTYAYQDSINDLNTALTYDGLVISVPKNHSVKQTLHIVYLYTQPNQHMLHLQQIIQLADNAQLSLIEHHIGQDDLKHFSTVINHVDLGRDASLTWHRWQEQGNEAYHINRTYLQQAQTSQLFYHGFDLNGRLLRNELFQEFIGEHASCKLYGLYIGRHKQQIDNYLNLQHSVPHCHSEQYYKGIVDDRAHAVFQGKVIVSPAAQKSDAQQHNANLILSTQAQIDTLPQLEIYADDVKCTHGATVGQLDESTLFYLQSRGLTPSLAKQILVFGFAADCLHAIENESLHQFSRQMLRRYFPEMELLPDLKLC